MNKLSVSRFMHLTACVLFFSIITSCTTTESGMRPSTGSVNELLIVTNDKDQWENTPGDTLRAFFGAPQIGLPQPEPVFDLLNVADDNFTDIFQKFHTILIVDINPQSSETRSETQQNVWAEPQRVIRITAKDLPSFYAEFDLKKDSFMKLNRASPRLRPLALRIARFSGLSIRLSDRKKSLA